MLDNMPEMDTVTHECICMWFEDTSPKSSYHMTAVEELNSISTKRRYTVPRPLRCLGLTDTRTRSRPAGRRSGSPHQSHPATWRLSPGAGPARGRCPPRRTPPPGTTPQYSFRLAGVCAAYQLKCTDAVVKDCNVLALQF